MILDIVGLLFLFCRTLVILYTRCDFLLLLVLYNLFHGNW